MDPGPVRIFTTSDLPRLRYIAEMLLGDLLGLSWEIVTDKRKLGKSPVINYSGENIKESFKIFPAGLLSETGVRKQDISVTEWHELPVFFQASEGSDFPFDIFTASFYLVSRYEEYSDFEPDEFGRFRASSSLAFRNGFLMTPLIDLWVKELAKALLKKFHGLAFRRSIFKSALTVDIDQPFQFLGKDVFRSLGGLIRDFSKGKGKASERFKAVRHEEKDPFDVYDYIFEQIEKSGSNSIFFIPLGDRSDFDRQPSWQNEDYRKLILKVAEKFNTGLHPSYYASHDMPKLKAEADRFKNLFRGKEISARCHFIRIKFPDTYRNLISAGITEDYSMGYPEEPGFRAGTASSFFFYDLLAETKTNLRILPFQIMDATLYQYKKMNSKEGAEIIGRIIETIKRSGGVFVSIWHNTSLLDNQEGKEWRIVFEEMLKKQMQ